MKRAEDIIRVCQANPAASASATDHVAQARRARRLWLKALQRGLAACWVLGVLALMAGAANAAALTWDPGHTPATPSGGAGTWDLTSANWSNGTSDVAWSDTTGTADIAVFSGTAGTVTLSTNLGALGLSFTMTGYTISGTGTLKLGVSGIDASTLTTGTTTIASAATVVASQNWNVGSGAALALSGAVGASNLTATLTGAGTVTLSGTTDNAGLAATVTSGTLVLAKTSTSSVHALGGATTVGGGTLRLGGSGGDQIYFGVTVAVNSGTFDLNGLSEGIDALDGAAAGTITNSVAATAGTLTTGGNNGGGTYTGSIQNGSGTTSLVKGGTGTLTLSGTSGFSGGVTISGGSLTLTGTTDVGTSTISVNGGQFSLQWHDERQQRINSFQPSDARFEHHTVHQPNQRPSDLRCLSNQHERQLIADLCTR